MITSLSKQKIEINNSFIEIKVQISFNTKFLFIYYNEMKELAAESLENVQETAENLIEKIKSGEMLEEGKSMLNNLMTGDAKDKIGNLAEEAKGLWDKLTGEDKKETT